MKDIRVLSLFTGGGGLDIGFHNAGFNIVACIEIDKASCQTLELNKGKYIEADCQIINEDITKLDPSELDIGKIDFIIGGPPCQSFSAAGRRAGGVTGVNDTRGSLFWYYCKYLDYFKPDGFLFENVRGILQANKSKDWDIIKQSFADLGYKLNYRVLDAADYGVPQHRERVILVGSKNKYFKFPRPTYGPDSIDCIPFLTVGEAFKDIDDPNEIVPAYNGKYGDLLADIPPGMNYLYYTEKMGHPNPRFAWRSMFSGFLYKLHPNSVSKTLVAQQGQYDGPFHWKNRKLNLAELKRLQSFPDDYKFINTKGSSLKQIGNSVAPRFAEILAKAVMNQYYEVRFPKVNYISNDEKLTFDKRKAIKAGKTKQTVTKNDGLFQLHLFQEEKIKWPHRVIQDRISSEPANEMSFYQRCVKLDGGKCEISIVKEHIPDGENISISIILNFAQPLANNFNIIYSSIESDNIWDIAILWDSIHLRIAQSSSYCSLQPLYGHFTEPYPKFTMKTHYKGLSHKCSGFIKLLDNFSYLSKLHPLNDLEKYSDQTTAIDFIKAIRKIGYDIRVHETNRAIPEGYFKICYPFTIYSKESKFVVWQDIGEHKTGDLRLMKTKQGYKPFNITGN